MDVAQFDIESWETANRVVANAASQGVEACQKPVYYRLSFGHQYGINLLTKKQYQLVQTGGRINIRIKSVAVVLDGWLFKYVAYQLRLAHSSRRNQQDMRFVLKCTNKPLRFFLSITEIRLWDNTGDVERILHNAYFFVQK